MNKEILVRGAFTYQIKTLGKIIPAVTQIIIIIIMKKYLI
jgi:hypothetical protein